MILSPETLRNQVLTTSPYERYFYDFHAPTHLNTGNYFIGLVIGYFYYQHKEAGYRHRRNAILNYVWHLSYLTTFIICFVGIYFYENDIEKGFLSALIGTFLKHIYGPVLGVLLVGIFYRYGYFIPKMFNYGMYRILARLSFSVFMVHVTISSFLIMGQKTPQEINNATLFMTSAAVYLLRYVNFTMHV
jgi:peptidoglycan/LPS O-acetylase OafA/YrhL